MIRAISSAVVLAGATTFVTGHFASAAGVWDRPAPFVTCSLDAEESTVQITLPRSRDAIIDVDMQQTGEHTFQGVSDDGVLVKYEVKAEGADECSGQKHRPEMGGTLQWMELTYDYATK